MCLEGTSASFRPSNTIHSGKLRSYFALARLSHSCKFRLHTE
jgi:hypothetical protein